MPVDTPISRLPVPEFHPPYYRMHKYWARKPHNIVRACIEHFTSPGDMVLDPFSGSGVTAIEAVLCGRKAVAVDINPIACLITHVTLADVDLSAVSGAFQAIEAVVKPRIDRWFATSCPRCGGEAGVTHAVWERVAACPACGHDYGLAAARKSSGKFACPGCGHTARIPVRLITRQQLNQLWCSCPVCRTDSQKKPDDGDVTLALGPFDTGVSSGIKNGLMFPNRRTLIYEGMSVASFFTPRNQAALSLIRHEIEQIKDIAVRQLLELTFTSCVAQASRLIPYRKGLTSGGPAWTVSGFWIPNLHFELNAWNCFASRYRKVINGKKHIAALLAGCPPAPACSIDELRDAATYCIANQTCTDMSSLLPDDSVEYIFTDPPYGDSVPYLEYSALWSAWLDDTVDYQHEIVISDSHERQKTADNYRRLMSTAFKEFSRVLKSGGWLTLTFHNRDMAIWDIIMSSAAQAGFELANCLYLVPAVIPARAQLSRAGSTTGDILLNFRKTAGGSSRRATSFENAAIHDMILAEAERIIGERGGKATTDEILRGVIIRLIKAGEGSIPHQNILHLLHSRFDGHKSVWQFREDEKHLVTRYEQLDETVMRIITRCQHQGITAPKAILSEVLAQLQDGRTPDIRRVMALVRGVSPRPEF